MATSHPPDRSPRFVRNRPVTRAFDRHGEALLCLASAMIGRGAAAESAVIETIADASARMDWTHPEDERGLRRELARLTYWRCVRWSGAVSQDDPQTSVASLEPHRDADQPTADALDGLSGQERAAIALCLYGAHTYQETAELLALPPETVARLLSFGLHRLGVDC